VLALHTESMTALADLVERSGAFAWWYVDLVGDDGRGLVLIWSFGLPFLPGARNALPARERPSLSLALYENFRPAFYTLQQFAPDQVRIESPECIWFENSRLELSRHDGQVRLRAQLCIDLVPSGRVEGTVEATGHACRTPHADASSRGVHRWAPILAAQSGQAHLRLGAEDHFDLDGRVYVDSNGSEQPLHALGIGDWRWGRVALPGRELIYYLVDPEPGSTLAPIRHVLEAKPDGSLRALSEDLEFRDLHRGTYGMTHHDSARLRGPELDLELHFKSLVDDGPFYLRFLVDAREHLTGERGSGVAERVAPARVDLWWQRPFMRMRTQQARGPNSMWLPLFSGTRKGRLGRLAKHWTSTLAPSTREREVRR
jgi:carotenoid 1,2-hydratase